MHSPFAFSPAHTTTTTTETVTKSRASSQASIYSPAPSRRKEEDHEDIKSHNHCGVGSDIRICSINKSKHWRIMLVSLISDSSPASEASRLIYGRVGNNHLDQESWSLVTDCVPNGYCQADDTATGAGTCQPKRCRRDIVSLLCASTNIG